MSRRLVLTTNVLRFVAVAAVIVGAATATMSSVSAADLLQRNHRHGGNISAYRDDRVCPAYEPRDYRPRTVNEPLCYAARPYGISLHLYDRSTLLDRIDDSGY